MLFRKRTFTPNVRLCIFWHLIPGSVHARSIDESLELDDAKIVLAGYQELVMKARGPASKCNVRCQSLVDRNAQSRGRLDRQNVWCDAGSALRNREKSRWPFCTVRDLGPDDDPRPVCQTRRNTTSSPIRNPG